MADPIITQCPKCDTSFRVTEAQLNAAKGAVRCGACLTVFDARKQGLSTQPKTATQPSNKSSMTDGLMDDHDELIMDESASDPLTKDDDDRFADDDSEFDLELDESFLGLKASQSLSDPFEEEVLSSSVTDEEDEEDWAKALLADDDPPPSTTSNSASKNTKGAASNSTIFGKATQPNSTAGSASTSKPKKKAFGFSLEATADSTLSETVAPKKKGFFAKKTASKDENKPASGHRRPSKLPPIEDEPLSLEAHYTSRRTGFVWLFAALLLAGALATQYVFYNFETLASTPQYRPYLERMCTIVGCLLPSKIAIHKIKTTTTPRARKHPTRKNALIIDVLMINTANFSQPFPQIEVLFSDQQKKPVASRRFMPGEYLKGELTGITMMPTNKEIHVRFEIVDPGAKATEYEVSFWPLNR